MGADSTILNRRRASGTAVSLTDGDPSSSLDGNPQGYCPNHSTGVKLPDGFVGTPLQYVD